MEERRSFNLIAIHSFVPLFTLVNFLTKAATTYGAPMMRVLAIIHISHHSLAR